MTYAMSWERNANEYKYESIQHGYVVEFDENENDGDLSLEQLLEDEENQLLEIEMEDF